MQISGWRTQCFSMSQACCWVGELSSQASAKQVEAFLCQQRLLSWTALQQREWVHAGHRSFGQPRHSASLLLGLSSPKGTCGLFYQYKEVSSCSLVTFLLASLTPIQTPASPWNCFQITINSSLASFSFSSFSPRLWGLTHLAASLQVTFSTGFVWKVI